MSITVVKQLRKLDLPRMEKNVAVAMAEELWETRPEAGTWVGAERIAAKCGIALRSVYRAIAQLKQKRIMKLIGYHVGRSAKMPKYTFHPENGRLLPFFQPGEPANLSHSPNEEPAIRAEEPANGAKDPVPAVQATTLITTIWPEIKRNLAGWNDAADRAGVRREDFARMDVYGRNHAEYRATGVYPGSSEWCRKLGFRIEGQP